MACETYGSAVVCSGPRNVVRRRIMRCWNCQTKRRVVEVYGGAWYASSLYCCYCGDGWGRESRSGGRAVSLRCACPDDATLYVDGGFRDETVFGPCRKCAPQPESVHATALQSELDRLESVDPHEYRENPIHLLLGPDELED